jgi:hypothetical protein
MSGDLDVIAFAALDLWTSHLLAWKNDGKGTLSLAWTDKLTYESPLGLAVADIDLDGDADFVARFPNYVNQPRVHRRELLGRALVIVSNEASLGAASVVAGAAAGTMRTGRREAP